MHSAVIVSACRTAVGRAKKGSLANTRPDELAAIVIKEVVRRAGIDGSEVQDVIMGCAMPEAEQGMNVARLAALLAGLPDTTGGVTVNRFCSSGLQTVAMAAQAIMTGMNDCVIAGGTESMTMVPMIGNKLSLNAELVDKRPEAYIGMGFTAENVAAKYGVARARQDEFALASHQRAAAAKKAGKFADEIVAVDVRVDRMNGTQLDSTRVAFADDELIREESTLEALAALKPSFNPRGSVTAGNSSPLSDGAAALLLMSEEKAQALGLKPLARFVSFAIAGVPPEIMGIGPVEAVPRVLKQAGLTIDQIDLIELNEAFAAQSLAVIDALKLPVEKVNVNGGAIALGHPLGCSGAKLTVSIIHELRRRGGRYGLITMCIGGGQGAAGIIEVLPA